ncbi:MAG TPA: NAD(P)-dependent oxidoreductase [Candidatus Polarisedimenticolia bacterium]|nr:NAD(P)-dependent oxidoreductase [Candidatus Polarisedimenticolia bacterium]
MPSSPHNEKPLTVLLTGASGYVGSVILDRLVGSGASVRVLALPETVVGLVHRDRIELFEGSLADKELLARATKGVDVVYHFGAALPTSDTNLIIEVNIRGTENLLVAATANRVRRFVHASSMAVYDPVLRRSRWPITEEFPLQAPGRRARSHYPRSKVEAEGLVRRAGADSGMEFVILRFPIVYGLGAPLVEDYIKTLLDRPRVLTTGAAEAPGMQWVHVDDLAAATVLAGTRAEAANQVFNISGADVFSMRDLLEAVAEEKQVPLPALRERRPFFKALAERRLRNATLKYDVKKAEAALGFRARDDLRATLRAIAADMNRRGLLPDTFGIDPDTNPRALVETLRAIAQSRPGRRGAV